MSGDAAIEQIAKSVLANYKQILNLMGGIY